LQLAASSGTQPVELLASSGTQDLNKDLNNDLAALGQVMLISRRSNRAAVERTKAIEAGYKLVKGSRTYRASVYAEEVSDAAFLLSGESGFVDAGDLLPDLGSRGIVFNMGDYRRMGYSASRPGARTVLRCKKLPKNFPPMGTSFAREFATPRAHGSRRAQRRPCPSPEPTLPPATDGRTSAF
jgi:hypothetical protein